jgi:hypothetical protein
MAKRVIPWEDCKPMEISTKAYIAGFLDGDGSIMLQIKPRVDVRYGFRLQATICFYQDSGHKESLHWMCDQLNVGYISNRKDGISELRVNGYVAVKKVLSELREYVRFKHQQVELMLNAIEILQHKPTAEQFITACNLADQISKANYKSRRKHSAQMVEEKLLQKGLLSP